MSIKEKPSLWVLDRGSVGNNNTRIAVANNINSEFLMVSFPDFGEGIDPKKPLESISLSDPKAGGEVKFDGWPEIMISTEVISNTHHWLKASSPNTFLATLPPATVPYEPFDTNVDMQFLFRHLDPEGSEFQEQEYKINTRSDVQKTRRYDFMPTRISERTLADNTGKDVIEDLKKLTDAHKTFGLILGSVVQNEEGNKVKAAFRDLLQATVNNIKANDLALAVTTSPRTPPEAIPVIKEALKDIPHFLHIYEDGKPNPYLQMLNSCKGFIISPDSISMSADVLATGQPVFVHYPMANQKNKNELLEEFNESSRLRPSVKRYMSMLLKNGHIHPLSEMENKTTIELTAPRVDTAWNMAQDILKWKEDQKILRQALMMWRVEHAIEKYKVPSISRKERPRREPLSQMLNPPSPYGSLSGAL